MTVAPLSSVRADALALWERSAVRTPFNHPDVVEAAGEAFGLSPLAILGADVGVIGLEKRRGPFRALALTPGAAYCSPICVQASPEAEVLGCETPLDAVRGVVESRFALAAFSLPPTWTDPRTFAFAGWDATVRYTSVADLSGDPLTQWSKGTLRPARQSAADFDVRETPDALEVATRLQVETYARKSVPFGLTSGALVLLANALHARGLVRAFAATRAGDAAPEAAALFTVDGTHATYWLSGGKRGPAMSVLFLHAVDALKASGVTDLDLGGANVPGVAQFKRQLGGVLTPTVTVRRVGPRWLRAIDALR
ncbi:GNAT family N-acetyltransferase [Rubricoccus marinus]|uniref:BioF2-like acetyltransferase domain-containing protein n=1 Tax=Rubricoccus marinus TaxID=716817 RepID=A0A259TZP9_9BACT|nr:GNAT family N-acetyltransferase [Rubricoccus marinus]OZC03156.1 hypothetical protein BSZ36_09325 [Rubricoccus marinus]